MKRRVPQPRSDIEQHVRMDIFDYAQVDHVIWPPAAGGLYGQKGRR